MAHRPQAPPTHEETNMPHIEPLKKSATQDKPKVHRQGRDRIKKAPLHTNDRFAKAKAKNPNRAYG
jgi:hypothetical protein